MIPWVCPTFYVNKHSEQKRGKKRLVINYKALNSALLPLRYPFPHKEILFSKLAHANVFSKFDLKSGFWQLGISPEDRYKTAFVVPQGQYQWKFMPFGLTNGLSEFQNITSQTQNSYHVPKIVTFFYVIQIFPKIEHTYELSHPFKMHIDGFILM